MITRGSLIGKIVDDFSSLKHQLDTRNKLGFTDLSLFCEDFIKEVLNITFNLNLKNLNQIRSNNPGLDLGDTREEIAFQITSTNTSKKVNDTLNKITSQQKQTFTKFKILIIGKKQSSYSIQTNTIDFIINRDIIDLDDLLKSIVILELDKLNTLYNLFKLEFRSVKIELEIVDKDGNFESSYSNIAETIPNSPPKNALKYLQERGKDYDKSFSEVLDLYRRLSRVPKISRELLFYIADRGKMQNFNSHFSIIPEILERIFRITQKELIVDINILENEGMVFINDGDIDGRSVPQVEISDEHLNLIFHHLVYNNESIRTLLNTMDFTILDEEE
ncbi:SMEK domain-containing protein [Winogradskyella forsetii]|uniref:SMEK domain-containing protein n=1 Tax=Winogradskyella forsetii TaxID=2686077 RepID=UPI0015BFC701|nr:SMEK domain-containing protein [Winogradskyella forsetii]